MAFDVASLLSPADYLHGKAGPAESMAVIALGLPDWHPPAKEGLRQSSLAESFAASERARAG